MSGSMEISEAAPEENEELVSQPDEEGVQDVDQRNEVLPTNYDITSYGADYPVDGLIKRLDAKDIVIPSFDPAYDESEDVGAFQRKFVWARPQMDKFIESLLLGLPVPGIFLVLDRSRKLLVLDGQQRLRTLQFFYSGEFEDKRYRLRQVQPPFTNLSYQELEPEDRRRLDDSIIHATVLRQDALDGSQNAIYSIFERLNTGGSPLQPQEIRVALYPGPFLQGLSHLNETPAWRKLYGPKSPRLKDHEMILRSLAMYENYQNYTRPLKGFLNNYLSKNQENQLSQTTPLGRIFVEAMDHLVTHVGLRAFKPVGPVNAAVVDSVTVGMMLRIKAGRITKPEMIATAHEGLMKKEEYRVAITSSTAAEDTVKFRINEAKKAFSEVL